MTPVVQFMKGKIPALKKSLMMQQLIYMMSMGLINSQNTSLEVLLF